MGHDVSSTCPKCNLEEETPNHHVGERIYYQALRKKVFGKEKNTIKSVVKKPNIDLLAKYLQQAGRLAEYGQQYIEILNKRESGEVVMGLNNGLLNVPMRIEPGQSSLAPPPFNNNNNNNNNGMLYIIRFIQTLQSTSKAKEALLR